jgi:hypothetical protein
MGRFHAQALDFLAAAAANSKMGERPQRYINFVGLDQDDHEWPRSISEPDHRAMGLRINAPMNHLHRRVFFIECDARVRVRDEQRNMDQANISVQEQIPSE